MRLRPAYAVPVGFLLVAFFLPVSPPWFFLGDGVCFMLSGNYATYVWWRERRKRLGLPAPFEHP